MRSGQSEVARSPAPEKSPLALLLLQLTLYHGLITAVQEAHCLIRMVAQEAAPLVLQLVAVRVGLVRLGDLEHVQEARVTQLVNQNLAVLKED